MTGASSGRAKPIRVLVTGPDITGQRASGVQQHVAQILEAFSQDPGFRVEPFAITSGGYVEPWLRKGVRLAGNYLRFPAAASRSDLVHINSTIDDRSVLRDSGLLVLCRLARRPAVIQFHGGGLHRLRHARNGLGGWFARRALASASRVLFLSEEQADPLAETFALNRVQLVSNYVACAEAGPSDEVRAPGIRILFMGRLNAAKGALETVVGYRKAMRPGWELRVAGSGPDEPAVTAAIAATDSATFEGYVSGDGKRRLLEWADVFVLPSAHDEGMPYGVLEAAAASTAVISSDRGGLSQVVREGWNGLTVPARDAAAIADALDRLADDPALLHSMKQHGREMVASEYSLGIMHDVFADVYREVLAARERGRKSVE